MYYIVFLLLFLWVPITWYKVTHNVHFRVCIFRVLQHSPHLSYHFPDVISFTEKDSVFVCSISSLNILSHSFYDHIKCSPFLVLLVVFFEQRLCLLLKEWIGQHCELQHTGKTKDYFIFQVMASLDTPQQTYHSPGYSPGIYKIFKTDLFSKIQDALLLFQDKDDRHTVVLVQQDVLPLNQ